MSSETAKFALEIEDGITASSESAEEALKSLQDQIDRDSKALKSMKKAMKEMQSGSSVDISAYRKIQAEIDATQNSISEARASYVNLGGTFSNIGQKIRKPLIPRVEPPIGFRELLDAVVALFGPLVKLIVHLNRIRFIVKILTSKLLAAAVVAIGLIAIFVALAAATTAVSIATSRATAKLLRYAAAQADAARSERLRLQGLGLTRWWYRTTAQDADAMSDAISRVAARVPSARSEVASLGAEVHRLGLQGRAAEQALESLSLAQAVGGERGLAQMRMLVRGLRFTKDGMDQLAKITERTYGDIAARQMMSLDMLATKLKESFSEMFRDIKIEDLLRGLYGLTQLLSQNTESGRALKAMLEAIVGPFIGELSGAIPALERFFLILVLHALDVVIAFVQVKNAFRQTFGDNIIGRLLSSESALHAFKIALVAIGIVGSWVLAMFTPLVILIGGFVAVLFTVASAVYAAYQGFLWFNAQVARAVKFFTSGQWRTAGSAIVDGIVAGLRAGWERLRGAIRGMATGALRTFREVLAIRSPSRIFAEVGLAIPQGVAQGIEQGAPEAQNAASTMVTETTTNVQNSGQGGTSRSITIGEINIHVGQGEDAAETAENVRDALVELFATGFATEAG